MNDARHLDNALFDALRSLGSEVDDTISPEIDELIAVLAESGVSSLSDHERQRVLNAVATDPEATEIFAELLAINSDAGSLGGGAFVEVEQPIHRLHRSLRLALPVAAAACFGLAALSLPSAAPPPPQGGPTMSPLGAGAPASSEDMVETNDGTRLVLILGALGVFLSGISVLIWVNSPEQSRFTRESK